jgi:hypothetical protein
MCGAWYERKAFSMRIQYSIVLIRVRINIEGVKCVVGEKTQEDFPLSLRD